jgi:type VI secretion system protein VasG
MNVNLRSLIGKLNNQTRGAVEAAAGLCLGRTHYDVEIEHYLLKLLDIPDGDLLFILKHYGIDRSRFAKELTVAIDKLKTGNARTPSLSPSFVRMLTEAWTVGSVDFGAGQVRSGHALLALALDEELNRLIRGTSKEFEKISAEDLRKNFGTITGQSAEEASAVYGGPAGGEAGVAGAAAGGKQPHLAQYTAATSRSARSWTSSRGAGRTTRSWWARRGSASRPSWRASPCVSSAARCRRRSAT